MTTTYDDITYADRVEAAHLGQVALLASYTVNKTGSRTLDDVDDFPTLAADVISNVLLLAHSLGEDIDMIIDQAMRYFDTEKLSEAADDHADQEQDHEDDEDDTCVCGCGTDTEESYLINVHGGLDVHVSKVDGGITGEAYEGDWVYHVTRWGKAVTRLSRYRSLKPMTHRDVAFAVAEYFISED